MNEAIVAEYRMSFTEVNYILMYTDDSIVQKIPLKFKKFLKENEALDYYPVIDVSKPLQEQVLQKHTLEILGLIYRDYICNSNEKIEYDKKLKENEALYEKELSEKYSYNKIFNNEKAQEIEAISENLPVVKEKESFFNKLKNKILNLLKMKEK